MSKACRCSSRGSWCIPCLQSCCRAHEDNKSPPDSRPTPLCEQLSAATTGSTGLDVSTADTVTIVTKDIVKVPLDARGPIGQGLSVLLLGRSSSTLNGLIVHVGVIDADFTGQICTLVSTPYPPVTIPKGTRIAQLILFPSCVSKAEQRLRCDGGFGSTGLPQPCKNWWQNS
uniref:dUTPase-like domain-containing protein n=1 Tax=Strix occidentalis caurina TaxID=311401 RepID=A0A8D0FSA8_STROC